MSHKCRWTWKSQDYHNNINAHHWTWHHCCYCVPSLANLYTVTSWALEVVETAGHTDVIVAAIVGQPFPPKRNSTALDNSNLKRQREGGANAGQSWDYMTKLAFKRVWLCVESRKDQFCVLVPQSDNPDSRLEWKNNTYKWQVSRLPPWCYFQNGRYRSKRPLWYWSAADSFSKRGRSCGRVKWEVSIRCFSNRRHFVVLVVIINLKQSILILSDNFKWNKSKRNVWIEWAYGTSEMRMYFSGYMYIAYVQLFSAVCLWCRGLLRKTMTCLFLKQVNQWSVRIRTIPKWLQWFTECLSVS